MKAIPSRYDGDCRICEDDIKRGDYIVRNEESGTWVHEDCALNDDRVTVESNGAGFDSFNRGRPPGIAVLPRGKTTKDRCGGCFQVPASNGVCQCE